MAAALILSPLGLAICILTPIIAILFARSPKLSAGRLASGYIGALFALAAAVAASSYVSPHDAASIWHIPADRYWGTLIAEFVSTFAVAAFAAILGISFVGIPALLALSNSGRATAPWLVIVSVAISTVVALLMYLAMHWSSNITFWGTFFFLVISHSVLAIGFSLAARLPWTLKRKL